jgi:hypothetical protein
MSRIARWLCVPVALFALVALALGQAQGQETTGTIQILQGDLGRGTITSVPAGIDCTAGPEGLSGDCEADFATGTKVRLRADAEPGSKFLGWAPNSTCPKGKTVIVEAGETHICQPVFEFTESPTFLLQVPVEGSGTVTSSPAGIDCTRDVDAGTIMGVCAENFANGGTVTLTADPAEGWVFVGWSGEDPDCADGEVLMDELTRCVATFARA